MGNFYQSKRQLRRPKGHISTISVNMIHWRNPLVTAWWSAAFPGFGHIMLGKYVKGFIFVLLEFALNYTTNVNLAIFYSFTGDFSKSIKILNKKDCIIYISVFIYAIWDSYRATIELNKYTFLSKYEKSSIIPFKIGSFEINYIDKRNTWLAIIWSALLPGMGHLFTRKVFTGFFILASWITLTYLCGFWEGFIDSFHGNLSSGLKISPQFILNLPSFYVFSIYDSYINTIEINKLFNTEQARFLEENYKNRKTMNELFLFKNI